MNPTGIDPTPARSAHRGRTGTGHPAAVLLAARGYDGVPAAVAHLSFRDEGSFVGIREAGRPPAPLVSFMPLPGSGVGVLEAVAGIDPAGGRLVQRFCRTFPATVTTLRGVDAGGPSDDLRHLLGLCSLLLDLGEADVQRAMAGGENTVRLETAVVDDGGAFAMDGRRLLRSIMSYRVAEVPGFVLAASVFASLGDFTGQAVRRLVQAWPQAQVVACSGDLFAGNVILREQARRSLAAARRPVLFP